LVIDKSFAQAAGARQLQALSTRFDFWVPSAFYYEVFDTEAVKRRATLCGFKGFRRVDLAATLRKEAETGEPVHEIDLRHLEFNPDLLSIDWKLKPAESAILLQYKRAVVDPLISFWGNVIDKGVIGFSAGELAAARGTEAEFVVLCEKLRSCDRIREIAKEIGFRHASVLNESWLQYRKLQTWILQGLVLSRRHRTSGDMRNQERIEHDVHDIEYLTLGLYVGRLATAETSRKFSNASMEWRFKLLAPTGMLLTPESLKTVL
jgi:AraC-like DNA-binding protein